jgi:hypothetical protein
MEILNRQNETLHCLEDYSMKCFLKMTVPMLLLVAFTGCDTFMMGRGPASIYIAGQMLDQDMIGRACYWDNGEQILLDGSHDARALSLSHDNG